MNPTAYTRLVDALIINKSLDQHGPYRDVAYLVLSSGYSKSLINIINQHLHI